jgi:hypothetical protein
MSSSKRYFTAVIGSKENGLYISSSPSSAARKIVSKLCISRKKKVEFCVRETTQGSKKKTYGPYLVEIKKMKGSRKYKNVVYLKKDRIIQGGFTKVLGEIEFNDFVIRDEMSDPLFAECFSNRFTHYIFFNPQTVDNIRFYEYVISHQYVLNEFKLKKIDKKKILDKKILDINIDDINTDMFVKLYKFIIKFSIPETEGLINEIKNIIIINKKSPQLIQNEVYFYPPIAPIKIKKTRENNRLPLRTMYGLNRMKENNSPMSAIMTGIPPTAVLMNPEYNVLLTPRNTSNEINKRSMKTYSSSQNLNNQTDSSPLSTISFSTARPTDRPTISARPTDRPTISARPKPKPIPIPSGYMKLPDGTIIQDPSLKTIMTNYNKPPIRSSRVISSKTNVAKDTIGSLAGVTESIVPKSVFDNVLTKFFL